MQVPIDLRKLKRLENLRIYSTCEYIASPRSLIHASGVTSIEAEETAASSLFPEVGVAHALIWLTVVPSHAVQARERSDYHLETSKT